MNVTTRPYTEIDRAEFDRGFVRGNYASAYETEDYRRAVQGVVGESGFYRIGFLLGFFSSYEVWEIFDEEVCELVAHHRAEFEKEGWT